MHAQTAQIVENYSTQTGDHADEHKIQQPSEGRFDVNRSHVNSNS
jgi:hypothetical protein